MSFRELFEINRITDKEFFAKYDTRNVDDADYSEIQVDIDGENLEIVLNGVNEYNWHMIELSRCCNFMRDPKTSTVWFDKKKQFVQFLMMLAGKHVNITQGMIKDTGVRFTKKEMTRFKK